MARSLRQKEIGLATSSHWALDTVDRGSALAPHVHSTGSLHPGDLGLSQNGILVCGLLSSPTYVQVTQISAATCDFERRSDDKNTPPVHGSAKKKKKTRTHSRCSVFASSAQVLSSSLRLVGFVCFHRYVICISGAYEYTRTVTPQRGAPRACCRGHTQDRRP